MKAFIFDIDGTLINGHSFWKEILAESFHKLSGFEVILEDVSGLTDRLIFEKMCKKIKSSSDISFDEFKNIYLSLVKKKIDKSGVELVTGFEKFIIDLEKNNNYILTLVSGNLADIAKLKLDFVGISDKFDWELATFANVETNRAKLLKNTVSKIKEKYPEIENFTYFGDTQNDHDAAVKANVKSIIITKESKVAPIKGAICVHDFNELRMNTEI